MEGLKLLKKYPMEEAIYYYIFGISEEKLENSSPKEIIKDYDHLKENVANILDTLPKREKEILQKILDDKMTTREVGELYDLSGSRVQCIANKALLKLCHPSRRHWLDGTWRQAQAEEIARRERRAAIDETWRKIADEIEHQKSKQATHMGTILPLETKELSLTPACEQKLDDLGIKTVGELLEKFPYDPQTNGLTGLTVADGIDETDYREIWSTLFLAGAFVRLPELPDFDALEEAEQATMIHDEAKAAEYSIPVSELQLSVKSYNFLMRGGVSTVGELLDRLDVNASKFLALSVDDAVKEIYSLNICHVDRNMKEIATCVREKLRKIYPKLALDDNTEQTLEELNARVKAISNGNSYIRKVPHWQNMGSGCYVYYRSTYKNLVFRKTNMFDPGRRNENRSGKNMVYFTLPEELDELIKFVEHDEKLYRDAIS